MKDICKDEKGCSVNYFNKCCMLVVGLMALRRSLRSFIVNTYILAPICFILVVITAAGPTTAVSFVFRLTKGNDSCGESYVGKKNTMFID